jgi:hypothetical protein
MFTRRKFLVHSASSLALTLGTAGLAKAAPGGWATQQGGSQDLQTKLVWLDFTKLQQEIGGLDYAITTAANFPSIPVTPPIVAYTNPFDDWRLPTLAEMTTACAHGLALNCPLAGTPNVYYGWWSSNTRAGGKQAATVDMRSGVTDWATTKNSYLYMIFVRKGT